jgi:hypothetical protein
MLLTAIFSLLVPALAVAFGIGLALFLFWRKKQLELARTAAMESLAAQLEMPFLAQDSYGLAKQLQGFDLFRRERSAWFGKGKVTNVLRGQVEGADVFLFDYTYSVQAGKNRKTITQTVFFANDKQLALPDFRLKPETWWHKIQTMLGLTKDVNFEENPDFSEKFWLKSDFEDLVRQRFRPELQQFLLSRPPAHLEGEGYYLLAYKPRVQLSPAEAKAFFEQCCEMLRHLRQKDHADVLDLAEIKKMPLAEPIRHL